MIDFRDMACANPGRPNKLCLGLVRLGVSWPQCPFGLSDDGGGIMKSKTLAALAVLFGLVLTASCGSQPTTGNAPQAVVANEVSCLNPVALTQLTGGLVPQIVQTL